MDDILTEVQKYVNVKKVTNPDGFNLDEACSIIPVGWHDLYIEFFNSVWLIKPNVRIISIETKKSVLFVKTNDDSLAVKWLVDGLAKESTRWCMLTPKTRGRRRKLVKGWPCLSTPLWIEYANAISDTEWENNDTK